MNTSNVSAPIYNFNCWSLRTNIIFNCCLLPVGILGVITNSLNVAVYTMIGFRDSITICFFSLSVCDLCFIIINNNINIIHAIRLVTPKLLYNVDVNLNTMVFYGDMLFDISACMKTFIIVQQGCCVAFPYHVNRVFTNKSTLIVALCLCLLSLVSYANEEFMKVKRTFKNPFSNETYYFITYIDGWILSNTIRRYLNRTAVVCFCEVLILLSLAVIVYNMSAISKWRHSLSTGKYKRHQWPNPRRKTSSFIEKSGSYVPNHTHESQHKRILTQKQKRGMGKRELRVVKQVVLVSAIHLLCYTPVSLLAILVETFTSHTFTFSMQVIGLYICLFETVRFSGPLCIAFNFFIYYKYNSKFKETLMMRCR